VASRPNGGSDGAWRLGRRAFLAVASAAALGALTAGRTLGQAASPGTAIDFPPSTSVDPFGDLAFALDGDVERIFRFVADEVRYEPYAGALRGARGTLASRAGNSADQALLLAALLAAADLPTRFAWGAIDGPTAATLIGSSVSPAEAARIDAVERLLGPLDLDPVPPPDPTVEARMRRPGSTPDDVGAWLARQVDGTVSLITDALSGAGITLPGTFTTVPQRERDQHVWVQVSNGPDWMDLDPSLPGQISGQALATATTTMASLPDDMWHRVDLAVIAESVSSGALTETPSMSFATTAAELSNVPISYVSVTPEGMKAVGASIGGGLDGWKTYVPVLIIGQAGYGGRPFRFSSGTGLFAGSGPAPDGEATAAWLQVTVSAPDAEPVVVRREVFDRVGDVARVSGSFDPSRLAPIELVSLGPDMPTEYPPARTSHWLTVSNGTPSFSGFPADVTGPDLGHMAAAAHGYQLARELSAAALGIDRGVRIFQNGANIAGVSLDAQAGTGSGPASFVADIWHRSFGQSPLGDIRASLPPALLSGVVSHAAERLLYESPAASADGSSFVGASVGAVFDAASATGIGLRVLTSATVPEDMALPADVALRLSRRLTDGWVAILPGHGVPLAGSDRIGWWLVDPATGETMDEMDDGRGQISPYAYTLRIAQTGAEALRASKLTCMVAGAAALATLFLWGTTAAGWLQAFAKGTSGGGAVLLAALSYFSVINGGTTAAIVATCLS